MIVLATHGSTSCRRAVERAAGLFRDTDVLVATVVPGLGCTRDAGDAGSVRAVVDELVQASAEEVLREACEVLGLRARPRLLTGDVALAICDLARTERADAIVVGSLAGDSVLGAVRGSVASHIAHAAPCSVVELGR